MSTANKSYAALGMTQANVVPAFVHDIAAKVMPVGSRVTCNPAPTDTDIDYLVLVLPEKREHLESMLRDDGFELDGDGDYPNEESDDGGFASYSGDDLNFIITSSADFYKRFVAATSVAKQLNLMQKSDRKALFQAVLYGNAFDPMVAA